MNDDRKNSLDALEGIAAMARQESSPTIPFNPKLVRLVRRQHREEQLQTWFLSVASVAAALILILSLPTLMNGLDPMNALFQVAYSPLP